MNSIVFLLRNAVQRGLGPVRTHRIRKWLFARKNTENGSCSFSEDWIYIYPTWACTLKCKYCQNLHATGVHNPIERHSISPATWSDSINRIDRNVVISGGDPFVYPYLADLVNKIKHKLKIVICSDLSAEDTLDTLARFRRPVSFDVSYHPCSGKAERFIKTVEAIKRMGTFDITIHAVGDGSRAFLSRTQRKFSQHDLQLKVVAPYADMRFEGSRQVKRETVYCSKKNINVGPDGLRYPCLTKAIRMHDPVCSISDERVTSDRPRHLCHDYGYCVPGDLEEVGMKIERVPTSTAESSTGSCATPHRVTLLRNQGETRDE